MPSEKELVEPIDDTACQHPNTNFDLRIINNNRFSSKLKKKIANHIQLTKTLCFRSQRKNKIKLKFFDYFKVNKYILQSLEVHR